MLNVIDFINETMHKPHLPYALLLKFCIVIFCFLRWFGLEGTGSCSAQVT